jgi:hypothetical protein
MAPDDRERIAQVVRDDPHELISRLDGRFGFRSGGPLGGVQARAFEGLRALLGNRPHKRPIRCIERS